MFCSIPVCHIPLSKLLNSETRCHLTSPSVPPPPSVLQQCSRPLFLFNVDAVMQAQVHIVDSQVFLVTRPSHQPKCRSCLHLSMSQNFFFVYPSSLPLQSQKQSSPSASFVRHSDAFKNRLLFNYLKILHNVVELMLSYSSKTQMPQSYKIPRIHTGKRTDNEYELITTVD